MRPTVCARALFVCLVACSLVMGQQVSTSNTQAVAVLQNSFATLTAGRQISDVTLTGSVRRVAGSDDETGTVTLKAVSSGATRLDFSLPSGSWSEACSSFSMMGLGQWSGPDGVSHSIANHNFQSEWAWLPTFAIANALTRQNPVSTIVGAEMRNDQSVLHISASQQFPDATIDAAALMQHLSQIDIFLNPATYLPVAITYNIHPDANALVDIPVEVQFSDYRNVNGVQVPFRVQKLINNSLVSDLQFQTVSLNTGITAAQIIAQ